MRLIDYWEILSPWNEELLILGVDAVVSPPPPAKKLLDLVEVSPPEDLMRLADVLTNCGRAPLAASEGDEMGENSVCFSYFVIRDEIWFNCCFLLRSSNSSDEVDKTSTTLLVCGGFDLFAEGLRSSVDGFYLLLSYSLTEAAFCSRNFLNSLTGDDEETEVLSQVRLQLTVSGRTKRTTAS